MKFGNSSKVFVIAEIGTSHAGNIDRAKELIDAAVESGADCAKFQIIYADEILHPCTGFVSLPGGNIPLFERFTSLEVPFSFYAELQEYCEKKNIVFLCSPFGIRSAKELITLNPSCIKIASPELNHIPLLKVLSDSRIPLIISSGVSKLCDIEQALEVTSSVSSRVLLHCVTSYPAPEEEYNLRLLSHLSSIFDIPVGVSDHSLDPFLVPLLAISEGACVIEKHICISRNDDGLDDPVALPVPLFTQMVQRIREAQTMDTNTIFEQMCAAYSRETCEAVLGKGVKKLAPCEKQNYGRTNRSIHYTKSLKTGEYIEEHDIAVLRTEKVLTPGIHPAFFETIIGARVTCNVVDGSGVQWSDIIQNRQKDANL